MKLFRRRFKTPEELYEFIHKLREYGHGFSIITMYTKDGYEFIEYYKDDGKDEVIEYFFPEEWLDE